MSEGKSPHRKRKHTDTEPSATTTGEPPQKERRLEKDPKKESGKRRLSDCMEELSISNSNGGLREKERKIADEKADSPSMLSLHMANLRLFESGPESKGVLCLSHEPHPRVALLRRRYLDPFKTANINPDRIAKPIPKCYARCEACAGFGCAQLQTSAELE